MAIWTSQKQTPQILKAADEWRQRCLLRDGSILSDRNLWTKQNISDLRKLFVDNPIAGGDKSFYDKLHDQIGNAKPEICQLASEAIWLLLLFVYERSVSVEKKRERIAEIWKFSGETLPSSELLADDCLRGLANPGISFLTRIWLEYGFLLVVMEAWKWLPSSEQSRLLRDNPWDLCRWVTNLTGGDVRGFRHMFLYFCYPANFERICSRNHKKQIYAAFVHRLEGRLDAYKIDQSPCGLDKSIFEIRQGLQSEYHTSEPDFYRPPLRTQWQKPEEVSEPEQDKVRPTDRRFWVEKTIVKGWPDRETGPHRVGVALWSPQKSTDGRDIYANMREVSAEDVVFHLTDNLGFTGVSVAAESVDENFEGVPGTTWREQPSYRIQLKSFQRLEPPLTREALFSDNEISQGLLAILNSDEGRGLFYNTNLELNQGAYLTEAPIHLGPYLIELIRKAQANRCRILTR